MRPLLIGISLLALISGLPPAAVAEPIENPTLAFGSVPWEFSTQTNTFSGERRGGRDVIDGLMELRAKFDDEGNFKTGTFQYRALDNHLLLQGKLSEPSVVAVPSGTEGVASHYFVRFGLIVHRDDLPFPVDGGEFHAFVCDPTTGDCEAGPTSLEGVFTTDYTDAAMTLNNFLFTFHDDVSTLLLAAVAVPAPAPGVLLGVGIAILLAMRLRRLT